MSHLRDAAVRLVNLFRRERIERELDAELQAYLELDVEENIRRGMAPKEARRAALARLGGLEMVKDECRDVQRFRVAEDLWRDLRYGVRMVLKHPGFSATAIIVLALGIGANSAIFSIINAMLLKPLPIHRPGELVGVYGEGTTAPGGYRSFSYPNFQDLREQAAAFANLAAHNLTLVGIGDGEATRRVLADAVTVEMASTKGTPWPSEKGPPEHPETADSLAMIRRGETGAHRRPAGLRGQHGRRTGDPLAHLAREGGDGPRGAPAAPVGAGVGHRHGPAQRQSV